MTTKTELIPTDSEIDAITQVAQLHPGCHVYGTAGQDGYDVLVWATEAESRNDDGAKAIARYTVPYLSHDEGQRGADGHLYIIEEMDAATTADVLDDDMIQRFESRANYDDLADFSDATLAQATEMINGYRQDNTDRIYAVYLPTVGRAGCMAGGNPEWTEAYSATDALERYLGIDGKEMTP